VVALELGCVTKGTMLAAWVPRSKAGKAVVVGGLGGDAEAADGRARGGAVLESRSRECWSSAKRSLVWVPSEMEYLAVTVLVARDMVERKPVKRPSDCCCWPAM